MKKALSLMLLSVLCFGSGGCAAQGHKLISIRLECADVCEGAGKPSFTERTIDNPEEMEVFQLAAQKAEKMNGMLNYVPLYYMDFHYKDGAHKKYVLNIDNEKHGKAILVDTADTGQGYEVPEVITERIRKIMFE